MNTATDDSARLREYLDDIAKRGENRLPPEPKLGEALGVSRGRLRTLLKQLESEGLIWRHVGKGTFLGPRQVTAGDQSWSAAISVDDIIDARVVLEPQLAAQAAIHATPADMAAMDQCIDDMARATSFLHWKRLDDKLHRLIAEATHNVLLLMLYDTLHSQVNLSLDARMEEVFGHLAGPNRAMDREHLSFIEAIRAHNPQKASQLMHEHLRSVRVNLFGLP